MTRWTMFTGHDPICLLSDQPLLLHHHCLQLTDTPEQPLDHRLQRPGTRHTKIIPGNGPSTGSETP
jgi:hypothetical protein